MELHYKSLFNYGAKYTDNSDLVKDCIQEMFIGLWIRRENLSKNVNPRAYLIASLRRAVCRKIQSEKKFLNKEFDEQDVSSFDFELSIEEKIIGKESDKILAKRIAELISTLPKRQKEIIYLKFFLNLNREEIAGILGNKPQTVSNLLQSAFKTLRLEMNGVSIVMIAHILSSQYLSFQALNEFDFFK